MNEIITSKDNKRVKLVAKLQDHPSLDAFVIEGFHAVEVAYGQGYLDEVYALEDPHLEGVSTYLVNGTILKKLSKAVTPERIIGICHLSKPSGFCGNILVLDRIQDPGNIGTLLRSAASFGFEDIVFLKGTCSPFNSKAIASCEGALFHLRLHFMEENEAVDCLKKEGYLLLGSALRDAIPMEGFQPDGKKIALILGNEGQGMSESLLAKTDANLKIAMSKMESLNVGVAGGILMHYLSR